MLQRAARAVGRIEVTGLPGFAYVGTGWLVDKNTIVTNRHVAREFGAADGGRFTFKQASGARPMTAAIDFLEEAGRPRAARVSDRRDPAHRRRAGPGLRAPARREPIRAAQRSRRRSRLPPRRAKPEQQVAVIGYPARDSRVPDAQLMQSIFGDVYDKKRLAPGQVTEGAERTSCSTTARRLAATRARCVLDLATGQAVGLHFAGRFLEANYAVPAAVVAARLEQVLRPRPGRPPSRPPHGPRRTPASRQRPTRARRPVRS